MAEAFSAPQPAAAAAVSSTAPDKASQEFERLKKRIWIQTWIILALTVVFAATLPFAQPVYLFYAMNPEKRTKQMVGLDMPNMTNRAVLAWATTSITEIMTMGFGDMDVRLPAQRPRFTADGWESYRKAFVDAKIGKTFKNNQLVLTTAPSNTPVIVGQGVNSDHVYEWVVQMPVIMTYATNNNVMQKQHDVITLVIIRVPPEEQSAGIAIDSWHAGGQ